MIIRCIDVETTGMDADAKVVEIGLSDVVITDAGTIDVAVPFSVLVDPGTTIPPEASAVHHITDDMVKGELPLKAALNIVMATPCDYLCAHVARFERQFVKLDVLAAPWLCTYKVALALAPNAPAHNLQTLRYWTKLDVDAQLASPPHRAGPDAYVCAALLARMLRKMPVKDMAEISSHPAVLPRFTFGKHAMVPLADVPTDYLYWMRDQGSFDDEDVVHTYTSELARRRAKNGVPA